MARIKFIARICDTKDCSEEAEKHRRKCWKCRNKQFMEKYVITYKNIRQPDKPFPHFCNELLYGSDDKFSARCKNMKKYKIGERIVCGVHLNKIKRQKEKEGFIIQEAK